MAAYDTECLLSDCESSISGSSSSSSSSDDRRRGIFYEGLAVELSAGERIYEVIRRRFLSGLGESDSKARVVSIHRRNWSDFSAQARIQSFQIHCKATANKHGDGGSPNVKFAWYGGRIERILQILCHGFSFHDLQDNDNAAVVLSPDDSPAQSVKNSIADEDGVRHVLLCRVLLGRSELVQPHSGQTHPSSNEFDSGVDEFENPNKYIIWSSKMNTHILPEYVVSFTASATPPSLKGCSSMQNGLKMPTTPWISFPALISVLGKSLPTDAIGLINKYYKDFKERRTSRPELIRKVRQIAGDKLLIAIIKSCRASKESKFGFLCNRNANKE